jgi:hypothetical protein
VAEPLQPPATTLAAGCRWAISRARFGPLITAIRGEPTSATSAITSLIRSDVPSSTPFIRLSSGALGGRLGTHSVRFSRRVCDGTASTTTSAPASTHEAS